MTKDIVRYTFSPSVSMREAEETLLLSLLATESLHGESQTQLDARHAFDAEQRACVIDAGSEVGRDLNRLFIGFLRREFGEDAFRVRRVAGGEIDQVAEAAA